MRKEIEVGDYLTFTATTREGRKKVRRKVVGISSSGYPEVRYHGWDCVEVGTFPGDRIHKVQTARQVEKELAAKRVERESV